jgi:hypothetical protein
MMNDRPNARFMREHRGETRQRYPQQTIDRTCPVCGTEFKAYRRTAKYCADKCRSRAWRRQHANFEIDRQHAINGVKRLIRWLGTRHEHQNAQQMLQKIAAAAAADSNYFRPNGIELARTFLQRHRL